jgi:CRISPR/Cas system-associated endoribonuclease Cas2
LTYGGLVVHRTATLWEVLSCFHALLRHLNQEKISRLLYKQLPVFYNPLPGDEVAFAMFLLDAQLFRRDCAMVVPQADRLQFQRRRRREIKKAMRFGVRVVQESTFEPFWEPLLAARLVRRYGVKPVHTVEEITLLASRFPDQIKQFSAYHQDRLVAGATIFETPTVAHAQYSAVSDEGAEIGALDFLFGWLIDERYKDKRYFDFGICNENAGRTLNQGMVDWKEGFGARCYVHNFYEITTKNHAKLETVLGGRLKHV